MGDYASEMEPDWKVKPGHERLKGFTDVWSGTMGNLQWRCDACGASFAVGSAHDHIDRHRRVSLPAPRPSEGDS